MVHLKQYKYVIALTLSNASDYICRCFHPLIKKKGKYGDLFFENLNFFIFSSEIALKLSKVSIF